MDEFLIIEAAKETGASNARVMGVAYTGGKMKLPGWRHPVVVELAGLEIPETVPLLTNHENRTGSRVGMVRARVEDDGLVIEGEILSSSGQAKGIIEQAEAGADWQLSIGAEVLDAELVRRSRAVNGRTHAGPFYHVTRSVLREVSVVAVGADMTTRMKVAARLRTGGASFHLYGGKTMEFEEWMEQHGIDPETVDEDRMAELKAAFEAGEEPGPEPEATQEPEAGRRGCEGAEAGSRPGVASAGSAAGPTGDGASRVPPPAPLAASAMEEAESAVRAERERVAAIQDICAGEFPEIEREAVRAGWDVDRTGRSVLRAIRESRPRADVAISVGRDRGREHEVEMLEAALCLRAGIPEDQLSGHYGAEVMTGVHRERDISLQMVFAECARLEGLTVPRSFCNDTIRAAFSTVSLPGILNNVANKKLLKAFRAQPVVATRLCSEGELNDFKESERYRLTDVGDLEPVAPDGEIKHGGLTEEKATNKLGTYGKIFALTRQMIYNDDLGAFLKVPEGMGARAARKIDQLFFIRLLANPNSLFSAGNGNYKAGADTVLGIESLGEAVQMFLDQTDADGQPINISPKFLLVPTALKMTARELLNSTLLIAVGSTDKERIPTYNAVADEDLEVLVSPYLSNANYAGSSSLAWYLFADPAIVDTFEIGYLKGRRTPTVEKGETDFNTLGIQFRVYFDLGVREQDHRGMVKFAGE
ncbi:MAG: Mu-like prophage major head subunit gpT family protein [Candidatus Brocadiia bacterium]